MAAIHPVVVNEKRGNTASNDEVGFTINSIELEKLFHIKQLDERNRIMERILSNDSEANIKFLWPLLYGIASIVGPVASTLVYTLIPCHNVISFPEYWYELPLQGTVFFRSNLVLLHHLSMLKLHEHTIHQNNAKLLENVVNSRIDHFL